MEKCERMKKKKIVILGIGVFLLGLLLYLLSMSIERFQNHVYHVEDMKVDSHVCSQYKLYYQGRKEKIYTDCESNIEFQVNGHWIEGASFMKNHSISMTRTINILMNEQEITVTKFLESDIILYEKDHFAIVKCPSQEQNIFYIGNRRNATQICMDLKEA